MTLVIPPGFGQVSIEMMNDFDPEPWYVTFGIDLAAAGGDFPLAATSAAQAFEVAFQPELSNQVVITKSILRVGQDGGPPLLVEVGRGNRGSSSEEKLPQNCAALIKKQTARAGRTGRGRMYLPAVLGEGQVSQVGVISIAEATVIGAAAQIFLEDLTTPSSPGAISVPMVLLHNFGVPGGTVPTPVTNLIPDIRIATQRRRLR